MMATILSQQQQQRREHAELSMQPISREKPPTISKESTLCEVFIKEFNQIPGWTCYPEAAGFDVLVVHDDGRQIGVEAKLSLNAKVADQILPNHGDDFWESPGPDHRLVIVSKITDASAGIAKMLRRLGVKVLCPYESWTAQGYVHTFGLDHRLFYAERSAVSDERMFDWSPAERCRVPSIVTNLPAGVPSPLRLTPWKESALKVVVLMRKQGFITAKQIASFGIGVSAWTQPSGSKRPWLAKGEVRGQWVETEHMPAFDKQHPDMYAKTLTEFEAEAGQSKVSP
ncbi:MULTISPECIES: hypothetical protein [Pseudomonas]|nr:hypothetical protein L483_15030 [Pseudomonas putida H8234]